MTSGFRRWWIVASVLAAGYGCGDDPPPEFLDAVDTWVTVPRYEIGSLHGTDAAFTRVSDVGLGDEGTRVYVVDPSDLRVTVWTPDGSPLFSVGGEGQGPGEFRRPDRVQVTSDGFQVRDRDRFVLFSPDGEYLRTVFIPLSVSHRGFRFRPALLLDDGSFLAYPSVSPDYMSGWWGDDPVVELPVVRLREQDGAWTVDVLTMLDVRNEILATGKNDQSSGLTSFSRQPYRDTDQASYNSWSKTVVVTRQRGLDPGVVHLTELSADGDTVWFRSLRFPPIALPVQEVEELVENVATTIANRRSDALLADARRAVREALYVPENYPSVRNMALLSNGEMWMRTHEDAGADSLDVWYAVQVGVARDSTSAVRRVLLPATFLPFDATESVLWGTRFDSFDVRYVVGRLLVRHTGDPD